MRPALPNPLNGRRHGLAQPDARLSAETLAGEAPAFRFDIRRSLRMHPKLAAVVAGGVFLLLVLYALSRKEVYSAQSQIYVEPLEVRVLSDGSSSGYDPSRYDSYLQQQVQTVERADTLEAALAKLPRGMWSAPGETSASAVSRLESALKVERVLNSYQLAIDVKAGTAEAAAAAANAVTSAYLEEGRKDEHTRADQRLQLLTEERQRITADMTRDKAEQASLGTSLGVANPTGASGNPYDLQSEGLRSQLAAAREAHDTVAAQLASVSGANGTGLDTAANELITADPGLVSIRQTLSQRRAVLSDQMAGLTPTNPVYKQDQEEMTALDRSIEHATDEARQRAERQLQDKLRLDLRRTADVEGRLNAQLAEQTAKATGAGPKLQRAAELDTDLQRLSTRFATVDDAIRGLQLETSGPGQAHLVLAARVPNTPDPSRRKLILLLSLPLALLCGLAAAVIARRRDPRLYLPGDLQEVLGFAPMCVLPKAGEVSGAVYDDFLLRLAGGLEGAYRHGGARSFVFTPVSVSASTNGLLPKLAAKLRQIGFHAGYMHGDDLMPASGRQTDLMLSAGPQGDNTAAREGVAATQMERILQEHDMVLIQAPPLLGSALTEYAVRCADATILLVESTRTDRDALRRAATLLERLNPQGIGAVLEDMPLQYADSGFRDAVRAADHASRPLSELRESVPPVSEIAPAVGETARLESETVVSPEVDEDEVWEAASPQVPEAAFEEISAPAAMLPVESAETAEEPYPQEEPAEPYYGTEDYRAEDYGIAEIEAAEPALPSPPAEEAVRPGQARVWSDGDLITFTEAPDVSGRNVSGEPAATPGSAEPTHSSSAAEGIEAAASTAAAEIPEASEAKPVHAWSAWEYTETAAEIEGSVVPEELSVEFEEPVRLSPEAPEELPGPDQPMSAAASEELATAEESKPVGWWRRLKRRTEEPDLRITPDETGQAIREPEADSSAASSVAPEEAVVSAPKEAVVRFETDWAETPTEASFDQNDAETLDFSEPVLSGDAAAEAEANSAESTSRAETSPEAFVEFDEAAAIEPWMRTHAAATPSAVSYESLAALPAPQDAQHSYADPYDVAARASSMAEDISRESEESIATGSAWLGEPTAGTPASRHEPPATSHIETEPYASRFTEEHVAADPNGPLGTFPRPRTSPITLSAVPSMMTSGASERRWQEQDAEPVAAVQRAEPARPRVPAPEPKAPERVPGNAFPVRRAGLARAAAQVSVDDGPPARASEGLTAMRTGAGLRKALERGEAALRPQPNTPEAPARQGPPGMTRRWAMLSRFERTDSDAPRDTGV